ncbi:MAG TPA: Holliday junction resolvase RuvX [Thermotogota bacterium]|jgi:putative Holliday junction resolvase|nr:Holliday junction resolvase RuvX [Thermotogota bacterium]NLH18852.1 Holliday junction resolvase RuvX [Thermotogaceae bacterium]OQC30434.1 MAG: putative Holliday junction resolvase [Thermotogota bacterium ADurb.Bin062]HNW46692.1 Holliday junction resolvase RuvX [Thermotogota bacterium]HNY81229.1 Holliday junction resolvase RuvX [Thermotogota bacterium]
MILACDYGKKRIGIAFADTESGVIVRSGVLEQTKSAVERIRRIVQEKSVQKIIVGLPLNLRCSFTESTDAAVSFASSLFDRVSRAVFFIDERFTTASVYVTGRLLGKSEAESRIAVDAGSAISLLDTYLKNPKTALPFSRKTLSPEDVRRMIEERTSQGSFGDKPIELVINGLSRFSPFSDTQRLWALREQNPWHFSKYRAIEKPEAIVEYSFHYGH